MKATVRKSLTEKETGIPTDALRKLKGKSIDVTMKTTGAVTRYIGGLPTGESWSWEKEWLIFP